METNKQNKLSDKQTKELARSDDPRILEVVPPAPEVYSRKAPPVRVRISYSQSSNSEPCRSKYNSSGNKSYCSDPGSSMSSPKSSSTRGECVIS